MKLLGTLLALGLAPLAAAPVERCKCGLKALEYSASGAPVVASPVVASLVLVVAGPVASLAATSVSAGAGLQATGSSARTTQLRTRAW